MVNRCRYVISSCVGSGSAESESDCDDEHRLNHCITGCGGLPLATAVKSAVKGFRLMQSH